MQNPSKIFKTESGLTAKILCDLTPQGYGISHPFYGIVRFADGSLNVFHWDHNGKVLGGYVGFNLTTKICDAPEGGDFPDIFKNLWESAVTAGLSEEELLEILKLEHRKVENLNYNELVELMRIFKSLPQTQERDFIREKVGKRFDKMVSDTIEFFRSLQ